MRAARLFLSTLALLAACTKRVEERVEERVEQRVEERVEQGLRPDSDERLEVGAADAGVGEQQRPEIVAAASERVLADAGVVAVIEPEADQQQPHDTLESEQPYFEDRDVPNDPKYPTNAILYVQENCGYCTKAKRWLDENRVTYQELDIADDANRAAFYKVARGGGTPVIVWDGSVIGGFSKEKMEKLLFPNGRTRKERVRVRYSESQAPRDLNPMYSYIDDEGSFHIVKSLEEVPKRYRARAKQHASH